MTSLTTQYFRLRILLPGSVPVDRATVSQAPRSKGSYALLMELGETLQVSYAGKTGSLESGWYVYCGSAHGPGGMRARLGRHFRRDKKRHWHVDQLTGKAAQLRALTMEDGSECSIVDRLIRSGQFEPALKGFGSSDCSICEAHLLHWKV